MEPTEHRKLAPAVAVAATLVAGLAAVARAGRARWMPIPGPVGVPVSRYTTRPAADAGAIEEGRRIYNRGCRYCHGVKGRGEGPVAFFLARDGGPHPRDFTSGVFKFRSTASGELPTDEDLFRVVTNGIPGFMPSFGGLEPAERWKVVYYVKTFSPDFEGAGPEPIEVVGTPLPSTSASIRRGFEVYQRLKCWECHGGGGKGDGPKAGEQVDDWGFSLPPADLTRPSSFKNGRRPEDVYRTIVTGLSGSPMPSYADTFSGREEDIWHLVNYILSLSQLRR